MIPADSKVSDVVMVVERAKKRSCPIRVHVSRNREYACWRPCDGTTDVRSLTSIFFAFSGCTCVNELHVTV